LGDNVRTLVGRGAELALIEAALASWEPPAVAVLGEPGIGKSHLLATALARADDPRTVIARGWASEFERQLPFGVVIDALDAHLGSVAPARLASLGDAERSMLARVFPSLADMKGPGSRPGTPGALNHAVSALLELLAADHPLVLVLDDLHWADQASVELVVHLLHRSPRGAELLLAFRPGSAPRLLNHAVQAAAARGACTAIELGPITREEAEPLLARIRGSERRDGIYREAGGNPFYLQQLARTVSTGSAPSDVGGLPDIPAAVARALAGELAELPARTRTVADAAAVAGEPFSYELVSAIAELDPGTVREALDEAVGRGLLATTPVPGAFVFRHPIVRRATYASAPPAWRLGAHERAAAALETVGVPASNRAHHIELSGRTDPPAVALLIEAGRASARVAPASAARWYRAALRTFPDDAPAEQQLMLLAPLAGALTAAGALEPARQTLQRILELIPREQTALRGRPLVALALIERLLGSGDTARPMLASAIELSAGESSPQVAALELELAADRYFAADWPAMAFRAEAALARSQRCDDVTLRAAAAAVLALAEVNQGRVKDAARRIDVAAAQLDALPDSELRLHLGAVHWVGWCEHHLERFDAVLRHYDRGLALGGASGQRHLLIPMLLGCVITHAWCGELAAANEQAEQAIESAQLVAAKPLIDLTAALRCWLAVRAGGLPAAVSACSPGPPIHGGPGGVHALLTQCWLGEALIEHGDVAGGRKAIVEVAGGPELPAIEPSQRAYFCELLTRAELAGRSRAAAEHWAGLADASAAVLPLAGPRTWALRARAELALAAGEPGTAAELALASVAAAGVTHPLERERSRLLAGRALAAAREPRAADLLEQARVTLGDFGADRLAAHAARDLRSLGRHVAPAARPPGRHPHGPGALALLSARELEVAQLVAEHLTNREIAERLVLSPKTIERHMDHIFTKLGVSSRGALARLVLSQNR
jgi:DNA-binding CsgD family transcriptional regulator/tetratricopeptide (TPR) repeat protein